MPPFEELRVFSGNAHKELARSICDYLGVSTGEAQVFKFANDNTFVRFEENIRQRDVFLVQPFCNPVNDSIMEMLIMVDAAKRASAAKSSKRATISMSLGYCPRMKNEYCMLWPCSLLPRSRYWLRLSFPLGKAKQ